MLSSPLHANESQQLLTVATNLKMPYKNTFIHYEYLKLTFYYYNTIVSVILSDPVNECWVFILS